jgi:hypothetical protein
MPGITTATTTTTLTEHVRRGNAKGLAPDLPLRWQPRKIPAPTAFRVFRKVEGYERFGFDVSVIASGMTPATGFGDDPTHGSKSITGARLAEL